jgi:hypothetical protein
MNNFNTALSLPKNIFNDSTTVHSFALARRTILFPSRHLNPKVIEIINNVGLRIGQTELFYNPPEKITGIHRDTPGLDISKINWVYQGSGSVMAWYDTDPNKIIEGPLGNTYKAYTIEESTLLHTSEIHSPSLVQAAIAHNIINSSEPRWAVSLMLFYKNKFGQCSYSDALDRLKDYILPA